MSDDFHLSRHEISPERQGSVLGGILGSITGMLVCLLVMLLCSLCRIESFSLILQLFTGMVIGGFYRLFHGRRSKTAAYAVVGVCTLLVCALWVVLLVLFPVFLSPVPLTKVDWGRLWSKSWKLLLLCVDTGLLGFFFTRKSLLAYADWKRRPWHIAYAGGNGFSYNLLPEKLPDKHPPSCFAIHSRFAPGTHIIVEGSSLRWKRWFRKDLVFSAHDIAGVVLGPSNGCNVFYDKNYQILAKFAGSMEHADWMFFWLLQWEIPIDNAPAPWYSPSENSSEAEPVEPSVFKQKFLLRMKRSARIGFAGMGCFLLLLGLALFLALFLLTDVSALTMAERWALVFLELAEMGMGIISLRMGKVCRVEVDGEEIRVVSRFGRATVFSVREVSSVSRSLGWIVLYDREFKTLAKVDSYLEDLDRLKDYLLLYGIKM